MSEAGRPVPVGSLAAAALVLVGALGAGPTEGTLAFGGLWDLGRLAAVLAALATAAGPWLGRGGLAAWIRVAGPVLGTLALAALVHRHPSWHRSPFEHAHGSLVGLPSHIPFVALAAAAWALARGRGGALARGVIISGTLGATVVLLMPHWSLNEGRLPLALGLELLDGGAGLAGAIEGALLCLLGLSLGAGWMLSVGWARSGHEASPSVGRAEDDTEDLDKEGAARPALLLAGSGAALLALHHLVTPVLVAEGLGAFVFAGLMLGGLVGLLVVGGKALLEAQGPAAAPGAGVALDVAVPAIVTGLYLLLKTHGMGPSNTDENIYFYMAAELAEGRWPYVDYFFAHPPLHVLLPGALFTLFGWSLTLAKGVSVVAGAISGLAIWALGRRAHGRIAAAFAMVAFLFAAETLKASTNMTGINLTVMWLTLGLWRWQARAPRQAGALFGLAASTGFYSMAAICAAMLLSVFASRREATRQLLAFLGVWGGLNLVCWIAAGDPFVDGVYRYHGLKAMREPGMVPVFGGPPGGPGALSALMKNLGVMVSARPFQKDLYYHAHLWTAGLVAPLLGAALFWRSGLGRSAPWRLVDPRRFWRHIAPPHEGRGTRAEPSAEALAEARSEGSAAAIWAVGLALFLQFAMFRELYSFYFVLIYPCLALGLGWLVARALGLAWQGVVRPDGRGGALLLGTLALVLFALWEPSAAHANRVFPDELEQAGKRNAYTWRPAPVAEGLSDVVRALYWEDSRLKGDMERGYRHYLWNKKRRFASLGEIATWVRERTEPHETIAGASTTTPLIALAAGRKLAAGEVDTNNKRFKTGLLEERDFWERACADHLRYVVSTSRSYFTHRRLQTLPTARRWLRRARQFDDPELKYGRSYPITLYERIGEPPAPGQVCRWEERE